MAAAALAVERDRFAPFFTTDMHRLESTRHAVDTFISGNCGVMHLAAASGTPAPGFFCASDANRYGRYGNANRAFDTRRLAAETVALAASEWFGRASERRLTA